MPTSNPALNDKVFQRESQAAGQGAFTPGWGSPASELPPGVFDTTARGGHAGGAGPVVTDADAMRVGGVVSATTILLALLMVAGWFGWQAVVLGPKTTAPDGTVEQAFSMPAWLWVSWIGGFAVAIFTIFKPKVARVTAPLYALAQGLLVGAISRAYEVRFEGIVLQAVMLTIGVFVVMLVLFATGAIKVNDKLRIGIIAATGAVALVYLFNIILSMFGANVPMIHDAGPVGIGFSVLVVGIAAFNLLLDFDFVQRAVAARAPRYMEWFAAFGLLITLIWLYLEMLRLLGKLRSN